MPDGDGSKRLAKGVGGHGRRLASTPPPSVQNTRIGQSFRYLSTKTTDTLYLPRLISKKRGTREFWENPSRMRPPEHFSVPAIF